MTLNAQAFRKYTSGLQGSGSASVSWLVQPLNRAPVARAGKDTTVTTPGVLKLNGAASADQDADPMT